MNLLEKYPIACSEWNYSLNDKDPSNYSPYSNKRVNWICKYGHTWNAIISNRTRQNNNCPVCYRNESWPENYLFNLLSQKFKVVKHRDPEIDIYIPFLNIGIEYDGFYHKKRVELDNKKNEWASVNLNKLIRIRESYLPKLVSFKNTLIIDQKDSSRESTKNSFLLLCNYLDIDFSEFNLDIDIEVRIRHYEIPKKIYESWSKNNLIGIEYCLKTHKYKWICEKCNSEYEASLRSRLLDKSCPYCSSQKVNSTNSLSKTHKYILKYISPNNEVNPDRVTYGTGKKIKFLYKDKEYNTTPRNFNRYVIKD